MLINADCYQLCGPCIGSNHVNTNINNIVYTLKTAAYTAHLAPTADQALLSATLQTLSGALSSDTRLGAANIPKKQQQLPCKEWYTYVSAAVIAHCWVC